MKEDKYYIFKRIDDPQRYFGLPKDEIVPSLLIALFCFWVGSLLIGILLGFIILSLIRHFKRG